MSLISVIQQVIGEVGDSHAPDAVVGLLGQTEVQMLALAKREAVSLSRAHQWQALKIEHTFSTADTVNNYALPADYGWVLRNTVWNQTTDERLFGPLSDQNWQSAQSDLVQPAIHQWYKVIGNRLYIFPTPSAVETISFFYMSSHRVDDNVGVSKETFTADTDVVRVDEELFTMGLMWRYLRAKGLPYDDALNDYLDEVDKEKAKDGDAPDLILDGGEAGSFVNVQEGNFAL